MKADTASLRRMEARGLSVMSVVFALLIGTLAWSIADDSGAVTIGLLAVMVAFGVFLVVGQFRSYVRSVEIDCLGVDAWLEAHR